MFAVKRALKLNKREATLMAQHAGFRRVVYNDALILRKQLYETDLKVSDAKVLSEFKKVLTNHTKKQPQNSWMKKMSSRVYQNALRDLATAFSRFRAGIAKHPQLARKKDGQSFTVDASGGKIVVRSGSRIKIPTLGVFRLHEPIDCDLVSQTFTVSKTGNRWYVSFCVDAERLPINLPKDRIGVDIGIKTFACLSDGQTFDAPKPFKIAKTKLAFLQRKASRQVKGSKNQRKTYNKIVKLHGRIAHIRKDFLHKLTTMLAKTYKVVQIEDLNIKGMMANHKLAGAIGDLGFYEFKRQLQYKAAMHGSEIVLVDQWFPSSKTCSSCGHVQPMPLKIRQYDCPVCKISIDRDLNAAINILNWEPQALRG
jgi:putative transposase